MKRLLISLAILSILLISCQNQELPLPVVKTLAKQEPSNHSSIEVAQGPDAEGEYVTMRTQLGYATKSGGIHPDAYREIDAKIRALEEAGLEIEKANELRGMLEKLKIGEEAPIAPQDMKYLIVFPGWNTTTAVTWHYRDGIWVPTATPPQCDEPFIFQTPVDLDLATAILYPGQYRGGDFKPHGGFRTDKTEGPVEVRSPIEGYIWRVAKFTDDYGIHYMFDIQHQCGIMVRLGHLAKVPPKMEAIFDDFPIRSKYDSRTELVEPFFVSLGEVIATDTQLGTGFDWGAYDLRKENEASKDPNFRKAHSDEGEQAYHALCWLDLLPQEDRAIVKGLPAADGKSGKKSDYC